MNISEMKDAMRKLIYPKEELEGRLSNLEWKYNNFEEYVYKIHDLQHTINENNIAFTSIFWKFVETMGYEYKIDKEKKYFIKKRRK